MLSHRIPRLNRLIKEEVGKIIKEEVEFPKDILVTVTKTDTSKDVAHAKISISILPENKTKEVMEKLEKNIFKIQKILNKRLVLKDVPKISFVVDQTAQVLERIEKLIEN